MERITLKDYFLKLDEYKNWMDEEVDEIFRLDYQ